MEENNSKQIEDTNIIIADSPKRKKCFVITPIGEEGSITRRHIDGIIKAAIRPALQDKYDVKAAHEFSTTGSINNQVIVEIYNSDLVVANLTELNPNVMYELAIRHSLKKPVIMIMEKGTKALPFDVNNERTIFYINDSQGVLDLRDEIIKTERVLGLNNISNPIFDALNSYIADESLIKNVEGKDKGEADVLKVILNKINRLESSLATKDFEISATNESIRQNLTIYLEYAEQISSSEKNGISKDIMLGVVRELNVRYGYITSYGVNDSDTINLKLKMNKFKLVPLKEIEAKIHDAIEYTLNDLNINNLKYHFEFN